MKLLSKLENNLYISKKYFTIKESSTKYQDNYSGYCGNYETYLTFKVLLKKYLDGINIYNYQGKYYSYDQLKKVYDIKSLDHSKFINDNLLSYRDNIDEAFEDLIKYHPEIIKISCKCTGVLYPFYLEAGSTINY